VKAASDVYAPLAGTVLAVNESLADSPEAVNRDAYGDGWIMQMKPADSNALNELMDAGEYQEFIAAE
jgi:glycine cleavage system H protein